MDLIYKYPLPPSNWSQDFDADDDIYVEHISLYIGLPDSVAVRQN